MSDKDTSYVCIKDKGALETRIYDW
jgi:hypothetical protein